MGIRFSVWALEAWAVLAKDLRSEFRTWYALNALLMFAVTTLTMVSFSIGQFAVNSAVLAALFWVVLFFSAMSGLARAFIREEESGTIQALRLAADPNVVFMGKLAFNLELLALLELVVVPLFVAFMGMAVANVGLFFAVLLVGSLGLVGASTIIAAIIAKARAKGALFTVLSFPVLLPLLVTSIRGTRLALEGSALADGMPELRLLASYLVVMVTASLLLFPYVWNE